MPALRDLPTIRCPACAAGAVVEGPPSRVTGRVVTRCRSCRALFLTHPHTTEVSFVPSDEMSAEDYEAWVGIKREGVGEDVWREATAWIKEAIGDIGAEPPRLYDVGAGDGGYLRLARDEFGFEVTGNEIIEGAVTLARKQHDIDLELGDIAEHGHRDDFDAVTLWCVLAHVPQGDALLRNVHAMLRPGGVVFLQTPHRTTVDAVGNRLKVASRGRWSAVPDRRLAGQGHHRVLHTAASITAQLERVGFVDVDVEPRHRYSLTSRAYLASLDPPGWLLGPGAWLLDQAISSRIAPRIVIDVRARKA
jgi:SAM-dependent methyltransferase